MLYIGWDIGIKNLAYCIIEIKDNVETIKELKIINLIQPDDSINNLNCIIKNKNNSCCKGKVLYRHKSDESIYYCKKHYGALDKNHDKKIIKELKLLKKPKKCSQYTLQEIGTKLFSELETNPIFVECNYITIENQPVLKNPTMKSIQIMLYSYFLIKNKNIINIKLLNAANKLKVYKGEISEEDSSKLNTIKDKYKKNKSTAILHSKYLLKDNTEILELFDNHKKKDDLADAYLLCKYSIIN
jgi:hypothetical protein